MRILTRIVDWLAMPYSLWLLIKDPHIDRKSKIKAGMILGAVAFYILNPLDVIPDITPVLGWLDDLVIVPAVMAVAGKAIPEVNVAAIRQKARTTTRRFMFWAIAAITGLILFSLSTLGLIIFLAVRAWS